MNVFRSVSELWILYAEAVIFGLQCGLGLGILVALMNAALAYAQQKVHVEGEDGVKYFYLSAIAFCTIIGMIILARPFVAPYTLQMQDLLNRSLAEIGFGLFNLLILAGAATVAIPAMVLGDRIGRR